MISIEPADAVPWGDVERAMTGGGDGASCWCQWFILKRTDFDAITTDERRELLRREVAERGAGLVAYVDGAAAGWVRIGPRTDQGRLVATRVVKVGSSEPLDAPEVWAITCLVVRREFRGRGIANRLVAAAVDRALANGARTIEAYPVDTEQRAMNGNGKTSSNELFVGSVRMFQRLDFTITARPTGRRVVMTRAAAQ